MNEATAVLSSVRVEEVDASAVTSGIDDAVQAANQPATVEADASTITTSIDEAVAAATPPPVQTEADTSGLATSIDDAVAAATPTPIEVPVDAESITSSIDSALSSVDTSGLQGGLDSAAGSASNLASASTEAGIGIGSIAPAAALATGETGALSDIVGQVTPGMAAAAAATFGVAEAGKQLFSGALEQNTALTRLKDTYGALAEQVEHVNFGGIDEDLDKLAVRTGANVDGLRNFAASFGTLGKSAGDSLPHIADVQQQIQLLAVRASVLNPNLGTADEIIQRLSTSLARGGRFLSAYGIALSTSQINAEALKETGKATASELSIYDKIVAGATLSTRQLGGALGEDINRGAGKAEVQLRSLKAAFEETLKGAGAPLIQPIIDAFREFEPVLASLARILGIALVGALHVVGPLLEGLAVILKPIADLLSEIPGPAVTALAGIAAFATIGPILAGALDSIVAFATLGGVSFLGFGATAEVAAAEVDAAAASMEAAEATALGPLAAAFAAVAAPLAIAASLAIAGGVAFTALTDDGKELSAGLETLKTNFADANKSVDESVATFARMQIAAQDGKDALANLGLDAQQVGSLVTQGSDGFQGLLVQLQQTGHISEAASGELLKTGESAAELKRQMDTGQTGVKGLDDTAVHLVDTFNRVQTVTRETAHDTLTAAVAHGELTRGEEVSAIAARNTIDGHVDWIAVLRDLQPKLAAAGAAAEVFGDKAAKTNPAVQHAADVTKHLADAQSSTAQVQLESLVAQGRLTQGQLDSAAALNTNAQGVTDYGAVLKGIDPALATQAELQGRVNAGLADTRSAFQRATDSANLFKTAVSETLDPFITLNEAAVKMRDAEDKLTTALRDSGGSLDIRTEKGRASETAMLDLVRADEALIDAQVRDAGGTIGAAQAKDLLIAKLREEQDKYPGLRGEIQQYIDKISGIPPDKVTEVRMQGAIQAAVDADNVRQAIDSLHDKNIPVTVENVNQALSDLDALRRAAEAVAPALSLNAVIARHGAMAGGTFDPWQSVLVGEQGPEVVTFPTEFTVHPHGQEPSGGKLFENLVVNEVAQNPMATAFAVATALGRTAKR